MPHFVIVGAMKAGTTTLHRWLGEHPDVVLPTTKELNHLCDAALVSCGPEAYAARFPATTPTQRTGEASPSYLLPPGNATASKTIASWLPDAALVVVLRDPLERLCSHHAHEVQRGRERRSLGEALDAADSPYLLGSLYAECLVPYDRAGLLDRLLVVTLEDLTSDDGTTWRRVLDHIGLTSTDRPTAEHNVTSRKGTFTPVMRWIYDRDLHHIADALPRPVRRLGKRALIRSEPVGVGSTRDIPDPVRRRIDEDRRSLCAALGWRHDPWLGRA